MAIARSAFGEAQKRYGVLRKQGKEEGGVYIPFQGWEICLLDVLKLDRQHQDINSVSAFFDTLSISGTCEDIQAVSTQTFSASYFAVNSCDSSVVHLNTFQTDMKNSPKAQEDMAAKHAELYFIIQIPKTLEM
jgi:hypothetical protein